MPTLNVFTGKQYLNDVTFPETTPTFATQIQDAMTENSVTYRSMLFNEMTRDRTLEEQASLQKFYADSWRAEAAEDMTAWGRFWSGWKADNIQAEITATADNLRQARLIKDTEQEEELKTKLAKLQFQLDQMPQPSERGWDSAYNLGQGLSTIADAFALEAAWWAGETAAATAVGAAAGGPVGAGVAGTLTGLARGAQRLRRVGKTASTLAKTYSLWEMMRRRESGSLYNEIRDRDDLTEDQKQAMALAYGRSAATVELAGWTLGAGGLLVKGGKAVGSAALNRIPAIERWAQTQALKQGLKETAGATVKTTAQRLAEAGKIASRVAAGAAAESAEEGVQQAMERSTIEQGLAGGTPTIGSVVTGGFQKMAGVASELVQGKLSEESISILEAMASALLPSLVVGGAGASLSAAFSGSEIVPANTGVPSEYDMKNSGLPQVIANAEKNLKRATALVNYLTETKNAEYIKQMVSNSEIEGHVFAAPEDVEMIMALGEMSPTAQTLIESTGIASAIREGRKTGTVEIPMQSFAEFVANEEIQESGVLPEVSRRVTFNSSEQSYESVDRKIRSSFKKETAQKVKEKASKKLNQMFAGLRRQMKLAKYSEQEIEANIDIFAAALGTLEEASNGAVTAEELARYFTFNIERRDYDVSSKNVQRALSEILGDKRRTLGYFRSWQKANKSANKLKVKMFKSESEDGTDFYDIFDETVGMRGEKELYVASHADLTTFAHEVMHFVTNSLVEMYNDGSISEPWRKEVEYLYDYFRNIKDKKTGNRAMHKNRSGKIVMEHEARETLSTGFQRYIEEGKADTPSLEKLYAFVKDLASKMAKLWKALSRGYFRDRPLSDVQTSFYEKVMQGHLEIIDTEYKYGYAPLEKMANVTDDEYELYKIERTVARSRSSNNMFKAQRQLVKNREKARWKEIYDEAFQNAYKALADEPEYILIDYIVSNGGINRDLMYKSTKLANSIPSKYYSKEASAGLTPQTLVEKFGPEMNLVDIAKTLIATPDREIAARREARNEADTKYLEETDPVSDIAPANAMRNILFIRSLVKESLMLKGDGLSKFNGHYKEWIKAAEEYVMGLTLKNASNLPKWADMESRITDDYITALNGGNTQVAALKADQRAMVNYVLVRSKQIQSQHAKFKRRFEKFFRMPTSQDLKSIDGITWNLIHTILKEYGYTTRRGRINANAYQQMQDWIAERKGNKFFPAQDFEAELEVLINPPKITSLSVEGFNRMAALVEKIRAVGEKETKVFMEERQQRLDVVVGEIIENAEKMREARGDKAFDIYRAGSLQSYITPQLGLLEPLFGELGMRELWVQLRDALVARDTLGDTVRGMIADSFVKNKITELLADRRKFDVGGWEVDNSVLLFALQHSGNQHNKQNAIATLQQYYKNSSFSETDYEEFLNATPQEMRNYVNDLWAMFGFLKKQIDAQTRAATGGIVGNVDAEPYTMRDGTKMTGGYFPAPKVSIRNSTVDSVEAMYDQNLFFPMTGFTKDRINNKLGDLDMGQEQLARHIYKAVNFATTQVAFNDIQTVLNTKELKDFLGADYSKISSYISDWVRASIMPVTPTPKTIKAFQKLPTVAFLGFKAVSGLVQLLGVVPAYSQISTAELTKSAAKILNIGKYFKMGEEMRKRSPFMADRSKKFDSRFYGLFNDKTFLEKQTRKYGEGIVSVALTFVRTFQNMADIIVWDAAHAEALNKGLSVDDARKHADYMVQKTQGDRTRMNTPKGFDSVAAKFFQPFMSYVLTLRQMYKGAALARKYKALGTLVALVALSAYFEAYFKESDKDWRRKLLGKKTKGNDKNFWKRVQNRWIAQTVGTFGGVAMPFAGLGEATAFGATTELMKNISDGYRAYTSGGTPAVELWEKAVKAITLDENTLKDIYDWDMSLGANIIDFML